MKSLKALFSSLLLLVICQFSQALASPMTNLPVYQNTIVNTSLDYEDALLSGSIQFDNGMTMHIVDYKTRDDNLMKTWGPGDIVDFKAHIKDEALIFSAKRLNRPDEDKVEPYVIFDVTSAPKFGLRIAEIKDNGKFVRLNDNSVWNFSWYNHLSTKKWKIGEHVIVCGHGDKNSYDFINVDAPVTQNVSSATAEFVTFINAVKG